MSAGIVNTGRLMQSKKNVYAKVIQRLECGEQCCFNACQGIVQCYWSTPIVGESGSTLVNSGNVMPPHTICDVSDSSQNLALFCEYLVGDVDMHKNDQGCSG